MNIIRLSLSFSLLISCAFSAFAKPSGVCPLFDDGTVLLGKETRTSAKTKQKFTSWYDFGGTQDPGETEAETALREFLEETGHYTFNVQLDDIKAAEQMGEFAETPNYRMYFIRIKGSKPTTETLHENARMAIQNFGKEACVEKRQWEFFDAQELKDAPTTNGRLSGTDQLIYGPMIAVLRENSAQTYLEKFIKNTASQKIPFKLGPALGSGRAKDMAQDIKEEGETIRITTKVDNASYQLESEWFPVQGGITIKIPYEITVEAGGKMSFGLLNTKGNGWYGQQLFLEAGENPETYKGIYVRTVPKDESKASLVFRNAHLKVAAQTTFTIKGIDILKNETIKAAFTSPKAVAFKLGPTFGSGRAENKAQSIKHEGNTIKVITDDNSNGSYQLESEWLLVKPSEMIQIPYKITVEPGGKMSLGLLRTDTKGWYGEQLFLEAPGPKAKTYKGVYKRVVPKDETQASLVFRNAHFPKTGGSGQTTFTIHSINILKK